MINLWKVSGKIHTGDPFLSNLREMVAPEKAFLKLILINSIAISILSLVIPVSVQSIITNLGILNVTQPIVVMSLVLFVILIFSGGIQVIQSYTIEILRRRLFIRYGAEILQRTTRYQDDHFQIINRPQLSKRFIDVLLAQASMVTFFVDGIGFAVQYIISIGLLCLYHPYFLAFGVLITLMLWFSWILFGPKGVEAGTPEADSRYQVMGWVDETLRARPLFMSKNGRSFAEKKFVGLLENWSMKRGNLFNQQFAQTIAIQFINAFVYAALLGVGYLLVKNGELSVGQLVAAFIVVTMLLSSLPRLQNFYTSIYDYSTNLDKLAEFWSHPLENEKSASPLPVGALGFSFDSASFPENVKLNFSIQPRERVYIYVRSYAAARVLNRALEGFLPPLEGEITIGEHRWDDIDFSELRQRVMVIGVGRFFSGSIFDNLNAFLDSPCTVTVMENALEEVGLLKVIKALPEGLHTEILPNGYPLSISESIALQAAKALLLKPSLILVTSDFDKMSFLRRKAVKSAFLNKAHDWTVVFLSQRLLKGDFDKFMVLERSDVVKLNDLESIIKQAEEYD